MGIKELCRNLAEKGRKTTNIRQSKKESIHLMHEERLNRLNPENKP